MQETVRPAMHEPAPPTTTPSHASNPRDRFAKQPTTSQRRSGPASQKLTGAWVVGDGRPNTSRGGSKGYGASSEAGQQGRTRKTNQDSYLMMGNGTGDFVAAVMDGHGDQGHHVSSFVKNSLAPQLMNAHEKLSADTHRLPGEVESLVKGAFHNVESALAKTNINSASSGSTTVACAKKGNRLYVANVGDSRAVLGRASKDTEGHFEAVALTVDHSLDDPREKARCCRIGGEVEPMYIPGIGFRGPARLWKTKQREGGLAVSRAFGDVSLKDAGVSAVPDVSVKTLDANDHFVILASDGVWDYVSNEEAVRLAASKSDPREASEAIVATARKRWRMEGGGQYIDDVTALVARLN